MGGPLVGKSFLGWGWGSVTVRLGLSGVEMMKYGIMEAAKCPLRFSFFLL